MKTPNQLREELKEVPFKKGEDCFRCGMSKKEARRLKISSCSSWGKNYKKHLYK